MFPCNTGFSTIDQKLSDHSIISLTRILDTPDSKKVQAGTTHLIFDPASQCYLEVRLRNAFKPQLVPQLHRKVDGTFLFSVADAHGRDEFLALVETLIAQEKLTKTHITIDNDCDISRIVQHRSDQLFVRSRTHTDGQEFLQFLMDKWSEIEHFLRRDLEINPMRQSKFLGSLHTDANAWFQAIAKFAFNYLAYSAGAKYVLTSHFDPI